MTHNYASHPASVRTVFLADDDGYDLLFMHNALRQASPSLRVEMFRNSRDLFSMLDFLTPDLLFLDLEMPCHQGLACLVELRQNQQWKDLPVIVFSSSTRQVNIRAAYELGADLFLIRPFDNETLVVRLKELLLLEWSHPGKIRNAYTLNAQYRAFV